MKDKKTFVMNKEWSVVFDTLSDEKAAKLIRAIFAYQNGDDPDMTDPELIVIFSLIKSVMDRNNQKYEERCERNRQNVQKRYESEQEGTNVYERIPSNTNGSKSTDNDNDSDNDSDNDVNMIKPPKGGNKHPQTPSFEELAEGKAISEPVKDSVREWLEYKKERREPYKPAGLKALLSQIEAKEQEFGASAVINVIRESMSNGWRGIIWDRLKKPQKEKSLAEEWGLKTDVFGMTGTDGWG